MARNEREVRPRLPVKYYNMNPDGSLSQYYDGDNVVYLLATGRDDAESTVPHGGKYFRPTSYFGRHFVGSSTSFATIYKSGSSKRLWTGTATMPDVAGNSYPWRNGATTYGLPVLPAGLLARMEGKLRSRILNQSWDAGQSLGELPETIQSIVELVKTFANFLRFLKQRKAEALWDYVRNTRKHGPTATRRGKKFPRPISKRRALRSVAQGVSQGWLAYKFFWLPILSDIHSALAALEATMAEPGLFTASASEVEAMSPPVLYTASNTVLKAQFSGQYQVKGKIAFKVANPLLFTLSQYGLTNPLSLAWELLPLSFVVDWFLSVGAFISALSRPMGLVFSWGYRTSYMRWSAEYAWLAKSAGTYLEGPYPQATGYHRSHQRVLYTGFPVPTPYFRGVDTLSLDKAITLVALALR